VANTEQGTIDPERESRSRPRQVGEDEVEACSANRTAERVDPATKRGAADKIGCGAGRHRQDHCVRLDPLPARQPDGGHLPAFAVDAGHLDVVGERDARGGADPEIVDDPLPAAFDVEHVPREGELELRDRCRGGDGLGFRGIRGEADERANQRARGIEAQPAVQPVLQRETAQGAGRQAPHQRERARQLYLLEDSQERGGSSATPGRRQRMRPLVEHGVGMSRRSRSPSQRRLLEERHAAATSCQERRRREARNSSADHHGSHGLPPWRRNVWGCPDVTS
jgi:hypothetical protein